MTGKSFGAPFESFTTGECQIIHISCVGCANRFCQACQTAVGPIYTKIGKRGRSRSALRQM